MEIKFVFGYCLFDEWKYILILKKVMLDWFKYVKFNDIFFVLGWNKYMDMFKFNKRMELNKIRIKFDIMNKFVVCDWFWRDYFV